MLAKEDKLRAKSLEDVIKNYGLLKFIHSGNKFIKTVKIILCVAAAVNIPWLILFSLFEDRGFLLLPVCLGVYLYAASIYDMFLRFSVGEKKIRGVIDPLNNTYIQMNINAMLANMPYRANDKNLVKYMIWRKRTVRLIILSVIVIAGQTVTESLGFAMLTGFTPLILAVFSVINIMELIMLLSAHKKFAGILDYVLMGIDIGMLVVFFMPVFIDDFNLNTVRGAFSLTGLTINLLIITVPFLLTCFIAEKRLEKKKTSWNNE